jgi:hypothetical protein
MSIFVKRYRQQTARRALKPFTPLFELESTDFVALLDMGRL